MATVLDALTCALDHQRTGRLPEAERIYRQVLVHDPHNVDALHLLGMVAFAAAAGSILVSYVKARAEAQRLRGAGR